MRIETRAARPRIPLLTACAAALALACAAGGGRPAWVDGADPDYPDARFVTAVGSGDDLTSASAQATGAIMQVFVSRVDQTLTDEQQSRSEHGRSIDTGNLSLRTVIESAGEIEGIQIEKNFYDRTTARHYALAVLDKSVARDAFANRLRAAESELGQDRERAARTANALERASRYTALLGRAEARDVVAAQYRFVGGGTWPASPSTGAIRAEQARAVDAVAFDVSASFAEADKGARQPFASLRDALAQSVSRAGFKVDPSGAGSVRVSAVVDLSAPFERGQDGFIHYTWDGSVTLSGDAGGEGLFVHKASGSSSHRTEALARKRTLIDAEETLTGGFEAELDAYVSSASD